VSRRVASASIFILALLVQTAWGASHSADVPVIDGTVNIETWATLPTNPRLRECDTDVCHTLKTLLESFKMLTERDFPNSMARVAPQVPPTTAVPIVVRSHGSEETARDACQFLATIVRGVADLSVVLHSVEIATLLVPVHAECARLVAEAAPRILEGKQVIREARVLCETRHEPACEQLLQ
jgi:hypothetical protein